MARTIGCVEKPSGNRLLDLPAGVGTVASQVRYELLTEGEYAGTLHPRVGANMTNDPTRAVPRQVTSVELTADEYADIDLFGDECRVVWVLSDGTEWPWGVFRFVDPVEQVATSGTSVRVSLFDRWVDLDQPVTHTVSVPPRGRYTDTIRQLVDEAAMDSGGVESSGARALDPLNWQAGTPRGRIIRELATLAGHLPPYFDNTGVFRSRPPEGLAESWGHRYDLGTRSRVIAGSVKRPRKSVDAPGAHLVINSGPTVGPVVGWATVDPDSPLHPLRRRATRVEVHTVQGVESSAAAESLARLYAARETLDYDLLDFDSLPDPRHDTWDTVEFDTVNHREIAWSVNLRPEGPMTHRCTRAEYQP